MSASDFESLDPTCHSVRTKWRSVCLPGMWGTTNLLLLSTRTKDLERYSTSALGSEDGGFLRPALDDVAVDCWNNESLQSPLIKARRQWLVSPLLRAGERRPAR